MMIIVNGYEFNVNTNLKGNSALSQNYNAFVKSPGFSIYKPFLILN